MFGSRARADAWSELEGILRRANHRLDDLESPPAAEPPPPPTLSPGDPELLRIHELLNGQNSILGDLDRKLKELTFAVEEGIERVGRSERRIQATIARARKELRDSGLEDPGLEAEAAELRVVDGGGSETDGVQPLPAEVAEPVEAPSSIRGVPAATLRQVRGI